ncbi:hypothetical protein [Micromonospora sp. WMMD812]|uniref:hypothetical protein n=1 Tax=Micromonospora sp. WMMD812 TaxID=3015152 RepID=UPI00248AA1DD|nr:hypothetical protein [Micromonospora sp. WMMD812]WBB67742.1 hypothetical protein O7603_32670 [Micromonospora sp. WMMD812]
MVLGLRRPLDWFTPDRGRPAAGWLDLTAQQSSVGGATDAVEDDTDLFGPILSSANLGSVRVIQRLLGGRMPGVPRIGLEVVDVRDVADLHVRAMTAPEAAGERFLGTGEFLWMREVAATLRAGLGEAATRVPTRQRPDFVVRLASLADRSLRPIMPGLGRRNRHHTEKARRVLGWRPRPATEAVVGCARSLIERDLA